MNTPVLVGMYAAWAAGQIAMAVLFLAVYLSRRRELSFLLFGCLCVVFAITDVAVACMYGAETLDGWADAANFTNATIGPAAAFGVHFAQSFGAARRSPGVALYWVYVAACAFFVAALGDLWIDRGSLRVVEASVFGMTWRQIVAQPTGVGLLFYATVAPTYGWIIYSLVRARRSGNRDTRGILVTLGVGSVFVINDLLVATVQLPSLYLTPFGFFMYGLGFALALVERYERAASDLEVTADELRNATDELTTSYTTLSRVQGELFRRRQMASVGELAGTIAHEVRNPLAVIRNAAASLRRRASREEDRETLLAIVDEEIDRLNGLVTELLRFARPVDVARADVSLVDVVQGINDELPEEYRLSLEARDPPAEILWADPTLLRLAVDNLVSNAVQAMPDGGEVTMTVERSVGGDGRTISRLTVTDSGSGMAPATVERAFDPFFTTRPKGTGLGLPIVRRIAEAHDGEVTIASEIGRGTTVTVTLPFPDRVSRASRISSVPGEF